MRGGHPRECVLSRNAVKNGPKEEMVRECSLPSLQRLNWSHTNVIWFLGSSLGNSNKLKTQLWLYKVVHLWAGCLFCESSGLLATLVFICSVLAQCQTPIFLVFGFSAAKCSIIFTSWLLTLSFCCWVFGTVGTVRWQHQLPDMHIQQLHWCEGLKWTKNRPETQNNSQVSIQMCHKLYLNFEIIPILLDKAAKQAITVGKGTHLWAWPGYF